MRFRIKHIFVIVAAIAIVVALIAIACVRFFSTPKPRLATSTQNLPIEYRTINVYTGDVVSSTDDQKADSAGNHEKQPGIVYPITDNKTYRILSGRKYVCEDLFLADSRYVESLEVKLDGKWKEIYRTEDAGDGHCNQSLVIDERSIVLSPLKNYVRFFLAGWEWGDTLLVNVQTKKNVLEKDANPKSILWSKDGRSYAFISEQEQFGGTGADGVWASGYKRPDSPTFIFDAVSKMGVPDDKAFWQLYKIDDLKFTDNTTIEFSIFEADESDSRNHFGEVSRYRYNLKNKDLKEIFRNK